MQPYDLVRTSSFWFLGTLMVIGRAATAHGQPLPEEPPPSPPSEPAPEAPTSAPPLTAPPAAEVAPVPTPEAAPPASVPPAAPAPAQGPPPVAAEKPPEPAPITLTVGGSLWTRYELRSGYAEHGLSHPRLHREGDYLVSRARLALKTTPVEVKGIRVSGTFVPQAAYTMGENSGATPTVSDHPVLNLYEGYASVGGEKVRVDGGRFAMNYGDAVVIGDLGWNEAARAFNGFRVRVEPGAAGAFIDGFATIITEGRSSTLEPLEGDTYFYGVYAGLGPLLSEGLELDAYLLAQSTVGSESVRLDPMNPMVTGDLDSATEVTAGLRLKGKAGIVDYRAEGGIQGGARPVAPNVMTPAPSNRSKFAGQIDAEIGVTPAKGLRVGLEGMYASGDDLSTPDEDEGYNELYPTTHKFLGLMDVIGPRTNIVSGVLHVTFAASDALKLALDAHYFSRPEANAAGKDGAVGTELNLNAAYAFGGGASLRGMYGVFLPDEEFWTSGAVAAAEAGESMHFFELQFGYDFK